MHIIEARNVNEALLKGMKYMHDEGVLRPSRNGDVLIATDPLTTVYDKPMERVLFFPERDANPFFQFMEGLWMLGGRNDVEWISRFNSGMANFTDNGVTFHGAYGYRWRNHFSAGGDTRDDWLDQLATIANALIANKDDRRIVLQMWDPSSDLGFEGKDFPCNLCLTFRINPYGALDMTVFNRSNDMIWGAYGTNAVHFSMLQEIMASWIGVPVGRYWQVSTNFHCYINLFEKHHALLQLENVPDKYAIGAVSPAPMMSSSPDSWFAQLDMFLNEGPVIGYTDPFFKRTALPMYLAWQYFKDTENKDRWENCCNMSNNIQASDWRLACNEWLLRRAP